jgi:hypothetical protein
MELVHLILFDVVIHIWQRVRIMKLIMQFFSNFLLLYLSWVQIFSEAACSQTPSFYVRPLMLETKFQTNKKPQAEDRALRNNIIPLSSCCLTS